MNEAARVEGTAVSPASDDGTTLSAERPFPGLRPFGFADRAFFFGRERQSFALYRLVEAGRFIAVIGSSGSGKSSLALAGLQRLLAEETEDSAGPNWRFLDMRPGGSPIRQLARTLARLADDDSADAAARRRDRIEWTLRQSSFSLERALEEAGGLDGRSLLLVVDQFEELFRFGLAGLALRQSNLQEVRAREEATQFVQILLDADRRRLKDVHVLITMRSDFIGDCAYFHGLPEAVSATQYLVPNLTRGQLEDAIRKPIAAAGASIEPELVERLLNDCGEELDQLPVLQHCLMRLWDRAGAASPGGARRLTRETYDAIGRMAEALSRHADEVLSACKGDELAVEQAFRALSEVDKGRAVRRALPFRRLLAETGVDDGSLRRALDKFRAPTCSFLVPPPSVAPTLAGEDRIDIGHEALLRRWKKLAGDTDRVDAETGRPKEGWVGSEQADGQRYRTLASLVEDEAGGGLARLSDPERIKRWWESLPRTPAWGERYGGRFDEVRKLIDDSLAAKKADEERAKRAAEEAKWRRRRRILIAAVIGPSVALAGLFFWQTYQASVRQQEATSRGAVTAARGFLDEVLQSFVKGHLTGAGSRTLSSLVERFVGNVKALASQDTPEAAKLQIKFLNVQTDFATNFEEHARALQLAVKAAGMAKSLVERDPADPEALVAKYDSLVRVGDADLTSPVTPDKLTAAYEAYSDALSTALAMREIDPGVGPIDKVAKVHLKVGDTYRYAGPSGQTDALQEYAESLAFAEVMTRRFPRYSEAVRDRGAANYRLGLAYNALGAPDRAFGAFSDALADQKSLASGDADDETLKSNLAASYFRLGDISVRRNDLIEALAAYKQGVGLQQDIVANDPRAPRYRDWLSPDYEKLGEVAARLNLESGAREAARGEYVNRREAAQIDPNNRRWLALYARATARFGDQVGGPYQLVVYREALEALSELSAKQDADRLLADVYFEAMRMADAFALGSDWTDAETAYRMAAAAAKLDADATGADPGWRARIEQASEAASEVAARILPARAGSAAR